MNLLLLLLLLVGGVIAVVVGKCGGVIGSDWMDCQSWSWFPCVCPEGMHSRGGEWWHAPCVLDFLAR